MEKLRRFMYGRYGTDTLNLVLLIAGLVIAFIAQLTRFWPLTLIAYAFYIYAIFRMLSRNTAQRQKEYYSFLKVWTPLQKWFRIRRTAFRERKTYKYFKCPNCRQQLRAPRGRGKILVTCQRCHKQFNQKT
ncbi:MAG: hypothetical protein ACOYJ5_07855 [Acutalibacteraceae bacterium]